MLFPCLADRNRNAAQTIEQRGTEWNAADIDWRVDGAAILVCRCDISFDFFSPLLACAQIVEQHSTHRHNTVLHNYADNSSTFALDQ
jgi:hypothetical protein